jgi:hypothetical protein
MAFVTIAASVGTAVGLTGLAATIGGGALIGAGVGGLYSAVTGDGDILNSMLTGGLIGGVGAFGLNAFGVGAGGAAAGAGGATGAGGSALASQAVAPAATAINTVTPAMQAAALDAAAVAEGSTVAGMVPAANTGLAANTVLPAGMTFTPPAPPPPVGMTGMKALGYGLAGTTALSLLGGKKGGAGAMPDPGMIRPYEYTSTPNDPTGIYPSPFATASYDAAGMPIMDTRERNYFTQSFKALEPYSAKPGTPNPNIPITAARGGIIQAYQAGGPVERMSMMNTAMNPQGGLYPQGMIDKTQYATPTQRPVSAEMVDEAPAYERSSPILMSGGGDISDEERNRIIMKNIRGASTKELEKALDALNQQDFLRKNMPAYSEAMRPSISSMVEGAQYGDRMSKSFIDMARENALKSGNNFQEPSQNYARLTPTMVDPQRGMYGGIAQIGKNIDPQTRVNAMADIERTPYDRNVGDSIRRVGVGVDRQIGRDANLSAFYEQDPMGRNKMGGARFTQRFANGGPVQNYGFGGLTLIEDMIRQAEQGQMPKYQFDQGTQRYNTVNQPAMGAAPSLGGYSFDPNTDRYSTNPQPMAAGGMTSLGGYSDGGRMLKGPGDGMSDSIPGVIGNKQPARLADGEFVVPADVVSHLGNGSTDAGAKRLYAMMDQVRKARTGNKKQGKQIKAQKYLPA